MQVFWIAKHGPVNKISGVVFGPELTLDRSGAGFYNPRNESSSESNVAQ
jgi:hypothetical protein